MTSLAKRLWLTFALLAGLVSVASHADMPATPNTADIPGFNGGIYLTDNLYIAGRPLTSAALASMKAAGVTSMIDLRTDEELADPKRAPFNEALTAEQQDIIYKRLPSGSESHPFSPDTVNQFAELLEKQDGKILLHCASGRRATHLWVAYLISHKGIPVADAIKLGQAANFGSHPLEGYLGGKPIYGDSAQD